MVELSLLYPDNQELNGPFIVRAKSVCKTKVAQKVTIFYDARMNPLPPHVLAADRTLAGLSQGGLASRAGITRRTVIRAEQGLSIHDRNLQALIDALRKHGVSIEVEQEAVRIILVAA